MARHRVRPHGRSRLPLLRGQVPLRVGHLATEFTHLDFRSSQLPGRLSMPGGPCKRLEPTPAVLKRLNRGGSP